MRKIIAPLLALALLLGLTACGRQNSSAFRTLEVIGARRYSVICRLDDRIAPLIDEAMRNTAASGELSAISIRWLGRDAITLKGEAAPEETPEDAEAEAEADETPARTLLVGVEADFEPMAYTENGALRGMSIDIADALGRALGWEVAYQPISPAEVGTQLASGNIDCALGFDPATVSASKYTVGVTYLESDVVLAVRPDSDIRRIRDIKDQRIGAVDDPVVTRLVKNHDKLTKYASGATVYLSPRRCVNALDNGWCAAVAMDVLMLEHT